MYLIKIPLKYLQVNKISNMGLLKYCMSMHKIIHCNWNIVLNWEIIINNTTECTNGFEWFYNTRIKHECRDH